MDIVTALVVVLAIAAVGIVWAIASEIRPQRQRRRPERPAQQRVDGQWQTTSAIRAVSKQTGLDMATSERLLEAEMARNGYHGVQWCIDKVIQDYRRDRR